MAVLALAVFSLNACDVEKEPYIQGAENEKMILKFEVGDVAGTVDEDTKTVVIDFAAGTDVSHLTPTITISTYATIEPESGEAQDFTDPVTYTVTAQNGTTAAYTVTVTVEGGTIEPTGKTVLIKDFTGARCVNCPAAAEHAHNLQHQLSEDHIFVMSVHAGYLAQPMGQFPDFLTDEGTEWYNNHDSNPLFAVDHVALTEGNTLNETQIDAPVAAALNEEQSFEIVVRPSYDEASRQLQVNIQALAWSDMDGPFNITVCLVEDHIIGWQTTPSGVNREYDFRNVFRGTLNGANGEAFGITHVEANESSHFNYSTEINADYNADECYLMVYVSQGDQILQTAVKKIKN